MIVVSWWWYDLSTRVTCQASWWLQSTVPSHLAISSAAKIINDSSPPPPSSYYVKLVSLFWSSTTSSPAAWSIAHRYHCHHLSEHCDWWRRGQRASGWNEKALSVLGTELLWIILVRHRFQQLWIIVLKIWWQTFSETFAVLAFTTCGTSAIYFLFYVSLYSYKLQLHIIESQTLSTSLGSSPGSSSKLFFTDKGESSNI